MYHFRHFLNDKCTSLSPKLHTFAPEFKSLEIVSCEIVAFSWVYVFKVIGLSIQEVWSDLEGKKFVSGND